MARNQKSTETCILLSLESRGLIVSASGFPTTTECFKRRMWKREGRKHVCMFTLRSVSCRQPSMGHPRALSVSLRRTSFFVHQPTKIIKNSPRTIIANLQLLCVVRGMCRCSASSREAGLQCHGFARAPSETIYMCTITDCFLVTPRWADRAVASDITVRCIGGAVFV